MNPPLLRSTFVTVIAWIFIALSGMGVLAAVLQNVMVHTLFDNPEFAQAMQSSPLEMPALVVFMANHVKLVALAWLLLSSFILACSIGLLRRWNPARLCFVGLLVLGMLWQVAGTLLQWDMMASMRQQIAGMAVTGAPDLGPFLIAAAVAAIVFNLGCCVLLGWIARRLLSAPIAAEFRHG